MRITQKLGILVAVPLCAVSGFGALALVTSTSGAIETGHLYTLMNAGARPPTWSASCRTSGRRSRST
ncbi:hypothetical protein ACFQ9X_11685 [Catenulispora yoronensis]